MAAPLGPDTLPENCSYGVCRDGRVFFVQNDTRTTTWLHPRTGEPVNSGHMIRSDLPRGWEEGFTNEGASYFINHNQRTTTFRHPVTGQVSSENVDFFLQQQPGVIHMSKPQGDLRPSSTVSEASTAVTTTSTVDVPSGPKVSRSSSRVHSFGKRDQAIKRNPNVAVVVRGWLYKQDSSGMRLWKRKWFVLADYCLFYYKDSREELVLGSIPLPSYVVSAVQPEDHISRKYAFKASHTGMRSYIYKQSSMVGSQAEHVGMRTYYFSADTQEDMNGWLKAMNQAALMQSQGGTLDRPSGSQSEVLESAEQQAVPQTNNVHHHHPAQPEPEEILLQPTPFLRDADECCSFHRDAPLAPASDPPGGLAAEETASLLSDAAPLLDPESAPGSRVPSRAPSRAASTLPPGAGTRNGSMRTPPTPIQEPNGIGAGTYVRASTLPSMDAHRHGQRRSALEQVEHWVKVQRAEHKGPPSREGTLPRRTPPTQPKFASMEAYQSLPKNPSPPTVARQGEYKYAQDRLSHFHLLPEGPHQAGPVWQLYEWQQRHQYRHGSPTAPLYTPAPDYPYGPRPASTVPPASAAPRSGSLGGPRCVSVPPSPSDIPPPGPPPGFSRTMSPNKRPHTPAGRLTVQPQGDRSLVDGPFSGSPRRAKSQLLKAATIERRSMPPSGYITHTVSAPSLHGKTPEELTLLLIQLRRHQAKMASARHHTLVQLRQLNCPKVPLHHHLLSTTYTGDTASPFLSGPSNLPLPGPSKTQVDDTYLQLKKDLEYLDLKVVGSQTLKEAGKPLKVAESDVDVKLSRLCEQDKILRELEVRLCSLKEDKDKLEVVLDMTHQQMEQYQDQPAHAHKIAYQQKLLQEDLVNIRAQVSRASTEMERAWEEYSCLESSVEQLRTLLQAHMNHSATPQQEKSEIKRELWRIEDVMGGLSSTKSNYQVTIDSVQNPERKLVPSVSDAATPSQSAEVPPPPRSSNASPAPPTQLLNTVPKWAEDEAPPRPPLPHVYDYEDVPPVVPPLPRDASVIRHTSVRGLKRQSDERKRDREGGHYVNGDSKVELRSYLSEPELQGMSGGAGGREADYQMLPDKGLPGSSFRLNQSNNISSYVTLRRGAGSLATKERPKSALERLYSSSDDPSAIGAAGSSSQQRGRMSAEEQLERMKRHQRALVRERKRNLSQGERCSTASTGSTQRSSSSGARLAAASSEPPPAAWRRDSGQAFGSQQQGEDSKATQVEEERLGAEGQSDEGQSLVKEDQRNQSEEWLTVIAKPMREVDLEPVDYDLDLSRELSMPQKVPIPERYVESDPDDPISPEEEEERSRRADRIKTILAKSNVQKMQQSSGVCGPVDCTDLESVLQQQERIMSVSHALASEASRKSKLVAAKASSEQ